MNQEKFSKIIKNKKKYFMIFLLIIIILIFSIIMINYSRKDNDFEFKTLSTECSEFSITGNIDYNKKKSSLYISNIEYCGRDDIEKYKYIECILYKTNDKKETVVGTYKSARENIKLEEFLKEATFTIDNYEKDCKEYQENDLYIRINVFDYNDKAISYKIPLKLETCSK